MIRRLASRHVEARVGARIERGAVVRCRGAAPAAGDPRRLDHGDDGQAVELREILVALVVGGHGHDGAGAVAHQHVIGDPDGHARAVDRVDGEAPVKTPVFSLARSVRSRSLFVAACRR